jgi:hypothetical protein
MAQINIENLPARVVEIVTDLAKDFKPLVDKIENTKIKTTQNNFAKYARVISRMSHDDKAMMVIVGLALIKAGANYNGVKSAWDTLRGDRWHRALS